MCFPGVERRDASGAVFPFPGAPGQRCLDAPAHPGPGAPELEGPWDFGTWGPESGKVDGGRGTPGLPYLARPALRGEKRTGARGAGFQLPLARWLAGSVALRSPPARWTRGFQSRPAPPPARPAPGPSSVPPHSRSSAPNRASASLQTRPPLLALRLRLWFFAGCRPGAVRRVVLNPPELPLCAGAGASRCPPRLGQTASRRAAGTRTGLGRSLSREVGAGLWVPICQSGGAGPKVTGCLPLGDR